MTVTDSPGVDADVVLPETAARGVAIILQGRGDAPAHYRRLARRLAADGYTAVVPAEAPASAAEVASLWGSLSGELFVDGALRVIVAPDTAASYVARALADGALSPVPAGVVLAGSATGGGTAPDPAGGLDAELALRSACPVHRGVAQHSDAPPLLADGLEPDWPDAVASSPGIPTLAIHGGADAIAPVDAVRRRLGGWAAELITVDGGLHDVLNDVHHRSVAAAIVEFLERLRIDAAAPVLTREAIA
ncbi:hypothetical protein N8K70_02115 [Microbacterium betulae]|uniref:Lysophospholipase n=1 Tax=Microbacterium betulae TaxID=2981139 RepID=A0AA97FL82_9MICO|nr:hypothetical protein [Microbacterium sp. AB]WOF23497.1 hypothetical protein N8K70_02115 [Microbacterium sp. AB]